MKKAVILLMVLALMIGFSMPVFAADNALTKLGRGVANVVSCPLEILQHMGSENDENGFMAGMTSGLFVGIWEMGVRAVVGVYEIVSFPVPLPKDYAPIKTDPEYFCAL